MKKVKLTIFLLILSTFSVLGLVKVEAVTGQWLSGEGNITYADSAGKVAIGTTSTQGKLTIQGTQDQFITLNSTDNNWQYIDFQVQGNRNAWVGTDANGAFNINTTSKDIIFKGKGIYIEPTEKVTISGTTDALVTLNSTDGNWQYMEFKSMGSRKAWIGTNGDGNFNIQTDNNQKILLNGYTTAANVKVGIGTLNPTHTLSVNGTIRAKEIIVDTGWADFVFEDDYDLMDLYEVEQYINKNNHLPGVPSAKEVQTNGASLGETNKILLQKIEEMTLHMIEMKKEIDELKNNNY